MRGDEGCIQKPLNICIERGENGETERGRRELGVCLNERGTIPPMFQYNKHRLMECFAELVNKLTQHIHALFWFFWHSL